MYLAMTLPKTFKQWEVKTNDCFYTGDRDLVTLPGQHLKQHFTIRKNARAVALLEHHPLLDVALVPYSTVNRTSSHWEHSKYFDGKYDILLNSDHAWMIYLTTRQIAERLINLRCVGYLDHRVDCFGIRAPIHGITYRYIEYVVSGAYEQSDAHREKVKQQIREQEPGLDIYAYFKRVRELQDAYEKPRSDYWELQERWGRKVDKLVHDNKLICCY